MIPSFSQAHVPHVPMDWIVIAVFAIVIVVLTLRAGTRTALSLALSLPVASFALSAIPSAALVAGPIHQFSSPFVQLIVSLGAFAILFVLVYRMLRGGFASGGQFLSALLVGIATTVIAVVFFNDLLGANPFWHFGNQVQTVFGASYRLWWVIGSYVILAFVSRVCFEFIYLPRQLSRR